VPRPAGKAGKTNREHKDTVETYAAIERIKADACIHCHNVYDFRREALQREGKWRKEMVWVYPLPENVRLHLHPPQGNRLERVEKDSAADRIGLKAGDILRTVGGLRTASFADVQYALHRQWEPGASGSSGNATDRSVKEPCSRNRAGG